MANPTINYLTKVINVPKSFLTLLSGSAYALDTNAFRIALRDIEDSEDGIAQLPTHNHNTVSLLGGIEYARIIEIINGYTITFEDGVYSVSLIGSNNNILDVTNLNQVSVRANNSSGLINVAEVQFMAFEGAVHLDVVNGLSGTLYPRGTPLSPVNNITDAMTIANERGFSEIHLISDLTITTGSNIDNITISSDSWVDVTVQSGVSMLNTNFKKVSLYGVMSGVWNILIDCWTYNITNFSGWVRGGSIGTVSLAAGLGLEFGGQSFFDGLVPLSPTVASTINMNTNTQVSITGSSDFTTIAGMTTGSILAAALMGGELILSPTCTGGDIEVSGVGTLYNNSGLTVESTGLNNPTTNALGVRTELTPELLAILTNLDAKVSKVLTTNKFLGLK